MAETEEELKSLLMNVEEEWKSWLKTQHLKNRDHGIQAQHYMANDRETMETVTDLIFLGSKITAESDCSHEIKKTFAPWKQMTNQDSILKSWASLYRQRFIQSKS